MEHAFWHDKWDKNQIGFHNEAVNPLLVQHFDQLGLAEGQTVLVPLCGKSVDLLWLLTRGLNVVGVELSDIAVQAFFQEHMLDPEVQQVDHHTLYRSGSLSIWQGDLFSLTSARIGPIDAVYDRAACVAMPDAMRPRYVEQVRQLSEKASQLLITYEYDQQLIPGPPFAVHPSMVDALYGADFLLTELAAVEVEGGLKGKVPSLERVWKLIPSR
ncbi:thiopurine S-methyltransferase [Pokkaliibacter sp. CJK22405]|uniref:thiopurine S-methyltransferase n=1 Tax=Pokkaliibacter sp. CJK22405 TaxID=3384615 RepID=UPI0039849ADE